VALLGSEEAVRKYVEDEKFVKDQESRDEAGVFRLQKDDRPKRRKAR
jgi:hypothetical protein